jgi:hypothetical protein
MKKAIRSGGGSALLLGIAITSWGCTEEETTFFIQGNVVIDAPECIARAEGSSSLLLGGTLDIALRADYVATLLVGSQLTPRGDKTNLRSETMVAGITGAEVHLRTDTGATALEFTVPAQGTIRPQSGADPGFGIVVATLIPASEVVNLAAELEFSGRVTRVAEVRVFGETIGGLEFESAPFNYVITVCYGCLIDFPPEARNADDPNLCTAGTDEAGVLPCNPGQDDAVDCRLCAGRLEACLAPNSVR